VLWLFLKLTESDLGYAESAELIIGIIGQSLPIGYYEEKRN